MGTKSVIHRYNHLTQKGELVWHLRSQSVNNQAGTCALTPIRAAQVEGLYRTHLHQNVYLLAEIAPKTVRK